MFHSWKVRLKAELLTFAFDIGLLDLSFIFSERALNHKLPVPFLFVKQELRKQ